MEAQSQPIPTSTPLPAWSAFLDSVHIAKSCFKVPALSPLPNLNPEYIALSHADRIQVAYSGLYIIAVHTRLTTTATTLLTQTIHFVYPLQSPTPSQIKRQKPQPWAHLQEALSDVPHPKSPTHHPLP